LTSEDLAVAQELYDGQDKKIITYPRAEVRYLLQSLISDVPKIVAGLRVSQSFSAIPVPDPPVIRRGASGSFYDKELEGRAITPSFPTSTRSTNCARSGLACRPTRKNCSTSSRAAERQLDILLNDDGPRRKWENTTAAIDGLNSK
jgi:hypothetical protein